MRRDLIAAVGALALVTGFVLLLGDVTGFFFDRHGPFDLLTEDVVWTGTDGREVATQAEVLTFRGAPLLTIAANDGDMTPALRAAPIPDSLNRVAETMAATGATPDVVAVDLPGLDFELRRVDRVSGEGAFLIRVTPEDAVMERALRGTDVTAQEVAERWRVALQGAFHAMADSLTAIPPSSP